MLLYIDPGTGGAIFQGVSTILAAVGGGLAVFVACLFSPVRNLFRRIWHALSGTKSQEDPKDGA